MSAPLPIVTDEAAQIADVFETYTNIQVAVRYQRAVGNYATCYVIIMPVSLQRSTQ